MRLLVRVKLKTIVSFTMILMNTSLVAQIDGFYEEAFITIEHYISNVDSGAFKKAVFEVENAYLENKMNYESFNNHIGALTSLVVQTKDNSKLEEGYKRNYTDFEKIRNGAAIFRVLKDTVALIIENDTVNHLPFEYDFEDVFGDKDWTKMFVTKLLVTHKGNCHSLPYLYKIIANELDFDVRLAVAPNHVYVKTHSQQYGWFNIELTSGTFPMDAWLMASSYVSMDAIRNGIYMIKLSEEESIALCLVDLAKGYAHKYPENDGSYIFKCTDLALKHYPKCIEAMLMQAELKKDHLKVKALELGLSDITEASTHPQLKTEYKEMEQAFTKVVNLGYRQMPKQMYINWLMSVDEEREKYENQEIREKH